LYKFNVSLVYWSFLAGFNFGLFGIAAHSGTLVHSVTLGFHADSHEILDQSRDRSNSGCLPLTILLKSSIASSNKICHPSNLSGCRALASCFFASSGAIFSNDKSSKISWIVL
jgi:hypothetical protein